jgi:hypothetical protein
VGSLARRKQWELWAPPPPRGSLYFKDLFAELTSCRQHPLGARHRCLLHPCWWWTLPDPPATPSRGPAFDVVFNLSGGHCQTHRQRPPPRGRHQHLLQPRWWTLSDPPAAPPRGLAINVIFNHGGGRCRTCRQRPPGGPPSTSSSTSVVDAAGPVDSAPQGARHRCLIQPQSTSHNKW